MQKTKKTCKNTKFQIKRVSFRFSSSFSCHFLREKEENRKTKTKTKMTKVNIKTIYLKQTYSRSLL